MLHIFSSRFILWYSLHIISENTFGRALGRNDIGHVIKVVLAKPTEVGRLIQKR